MILSLETATTVCSVALGENGILIEEKALNQPHIHSEKLLPLINDCLNTKKVHPFSINAVAISIGPGSFTGLRIGLSVAKGLCFAWNVPLVAVPTLYGLAWNCLAQHIGYGGDYILSLLDARKEEVYAAMYVKHEDDLEEIVPARAITLQQCAEVIRHNHRTLLIGDGAEKLHRFLKQDSPGRTDIIVASEEEHRCSAGSIALLGERLFNKGTIAELTSLEPEYCKEFITGAQPQRMVSEHGMV